MYSVFLDDAQILLEYLDVFSGDLPILKKEIGLLNMHKAISIICELIQLRDSKIKISSILELDIPYETVLKKMCGIDAKSPEEMLSCPMLRKNIHIISVQMLMLLLKQILRYGNYDTLNNLEYDITEDDYIKIIQLQLVVVEEINKKHLDPEYDKNHFLYASYHFNYKRNVANEFLRMYYMMDKLSRDKNIFDADVQNEYKDYYTDFSQKYGFTPTQYSFLLFGELSPYYSDDEKRLSFRSIWRDFETIYKDVNNKALIYKVIQSLSQPVESFRDWANETRDQEWDFSKFFEYPFLLDPKGNYLSICDITLRNAFFEKMFWLIRDCYPQDDNNSMAFFGRLFEKYIQDLTENASQNEYEYIPEFTCKIKRNSIKSSDAYVRKKNQLLVVEAKGFSVLLDCMIKNEKIENNNKKLFINPVLQADSFLAAAITKHCSIKGIQEAFIVSVTLDSINAVPEYYNVIHTTISKEKSCSATKYFFNFNIEEYEMLMFLMEQNYDIFSILSDYFCNDSLRPFSSFIQDSYEQIDMTIFMEKMYQEASAKMKEMLFP